MTLTWTATRTNNPLNGVESPLVMERELASLRASQPQMRAGGSIDPELARLQRMLTAAEGRARGGGHVAFADPTVASVRAQIELYYTAKREQAYFADSHPFVAALGWVLTPHLQSGLDFNETLATAAPGAAGTARVPGRPAVYQPLPLGNGRTANLSPAEFAQGARLNPGRSPGLSVPRVDSGVHGGGVPATISQTPSQQLLLNHRRTTASLNQIHNMRQPTKWEAGEQHAQELFGSIGKRHFPVPTRGGRYVDAPVDLSSGGVLAVEVKTYNQG